MATPCAIYVRISRDKIGAGIGVRDQEHDCRELAKRIDWAPIDVYIDNDLSAYSGKLRPEYQRLLSDMASGRVTRVITWHTDRLHRAPRELEDYIDASEKCAAVTETVQAGPLDLSTPSGRMIARQLCVVARYESEHKSARIRARMDSLARDRKTMGGGHRPFGFEMDRQTVREEEAAILREAADRLLSGEGVRSVARDLAARKIPLPAGGSWSGQRLRQCLLRPSVAGLYTHRGEILGAAKWEPLVPEATWRQLARLLTDPSRHTGGRGPVNLLAGIVKCDCGKGMTSVYSSAKEAPAQRKWYYCRSCKWRRSIPVVDEYVRARVVGYLSQLDVPDLTLPGEPGLGARIEQLRARLVELQGMGADPDFTIAEIRLMKREASSELARLESEAEHNGRPPVLRGLAGVSADELWRLWEEWPLDRRRAVVSACYEVILIRPNRHMPRGPLRDAEITMRPLLASS